jgi:hypothetical protein
MLLAELVSSSIVCVVAAVTCTRHSQQVDSQQNMGRS